MSSLRHSLHFRQGVLYLGVFSVSVLLLGFFITLTTQRFLMTQLKSHIESGTLQLLGDYRQDGLEELRHDIQERIDSEDPERLWYVLGLPDGRTEFDHLNSLPDSGWHELEDADHNLLMLVTELENGYKLGVGLTIDRVHAVEKALQRTFTFAILAMLLLGAIGGYLVSRGFVRRLEAIKNVALKFGEGDFKRRLPASPAGDEFDQLSITLNRMFEHVETLVSEVQRVTSNIAHDLRTPLGRIKQKIEALQTNGEFSAGTQAAIDDISDNLNSTLATFSALLRIAEVELGTRKAGFVEFDLHEVLEQLSSAYSAVVEENGRQIYFHSHAGFNICGDKILVVQILANLIENALQHTPDGSVIHVSLSRAGSHIQLEVKDNGIGISSEQTEQVLKPFFKIDRSRGRSQGSGLGLSLVAAVSKLHDAALSLRNLNPGLSIQILFSEA